MSHINMRSLRSRRQSSRRSRPRLRSESGFSLIELLIVLVIIGILAGIAIPRYMSSTTKAKQVEAKELLHQIYMMERSYFLEHDGYWIPDVGVEASKDYPYAFDQIGVEIMSSARYTYTIEETESGFRAVATSYKLDDDPAVDRWSITESGSLIPESDDSVER